ncbi:hypothetical protein HN51_028614 [Arachis hypogaea]
MANHTIILKKTTILPFLTCKICDELLEDATAIVECLHLFCKKCIHHKIIEEELEHCPVCDLNLGPKPLEKLRHDESMQSIGNTIFPPRKRNIVNKVDDDVANAEKNELLGDLGRILFEDPENEKDVALKDLPYTSKEHVENIKESLLPSEKSHCMQNKNVKGKSICPDNVEGYNTDELDQMEDNNNGSQVEITCLGHQISTKMELKKLAKLWFNMSFKGKSKTKPSPNDYIAIIGYGRGVSQS